MPGPDLTPPVYVSFQSQMLPNGQPRTLDYSRPGHSLDPAPALSPFQQGGFPPPISEFTSAQLPLARLADKSDSVMAQGMLKK